MIKSFRQFLEEGVHDPGIFKAIFLAGGPGAGKTFVAHKTLPNSAFGLKVVNTDQALEYLLKKSGMSMDMLQMTPDELEQFAAKRARAKELTQLKTKAFVKGRLGMVIDGTGHNYEKIAKRKKELESIGYDTFMVFVNTSLDVALERNRARPRSVDERVVRKFWEEVQGNIGKFQQLFGAQNFVIVDNNDVTEDVLLDTFKAAKKFVDRPVRSRLAKAWIARELRKVKRK